MTSGRKRKERRQQRRAEAEAAKNPTPEAIIGAGEPNTPAEEIEARRVSRLEARAVARGWIKGTRWPTDATVQDLIEVSHQRPLTLKEKVAVKVWADLDKVDPLVASNAVRSALIMEQQNQRDDIASDRDQSAEHRALTTGPAALVPVIMAPGSSVVLYLPDNRRDVVDSTAATID